MVWLLGGGLLGGGGIEGGGGGRYAWTWRKGSELLVDDIMVGLE